MKTWPEAPLSTTVLLKTVMLCFSFYFRFSAACSPATRPKATDWE